MGDQELWKKAEEGERALNEWLGSENLAYVFLNQSRETFAKLFVGDVKRPDFLLVLEGVGIIAIDAKNKEPSNRNEYTLSLESELRKTIAFERIFRMSVWYAYKGKRPGLWYWISALKALEVGEIRERNDDGEKFLAIKRKEFLKIQSCKDLGKLYTQKLPGMTRISGLLS